MPSSDAEIRPFRSRVLFALAMLPRKAGLALIRFYQIVVSPLLVAISGPGSGCRFHPTCSHYAAGAVERHGLLAGVWLAVRRLAKCHPWNPGGDDPVPEQPPFQLTRIRHDRAPFRGAAPHNG